MTDAVHVSISEVFVREECVAAFQRITRMLFNRRNVLRLGEWDKLFQLPELVAILRSESAAYRAQSAENTGPIPVELGFLDLRGREVVCVASPWPANAQFDLIVEILREWVEPRGTFQAGERVYTFGPLAQD